jgi:hypothetical protein
LNVTYELGGSHEILFTCKLNGLVQLRQVFYYCHSLCNLFLSVSRIKPIRIGFKCIKAKLSAKINGLILISRLGIPYNISRHFTTADSF